MLRIDGDRHQTKVRNVCQVGLKLGHLGGHQRTLVGAVREDKACDPDVSREIGLPQRTTVLIDEGKIGHRAVHGEAD
jgi:hypothetical protein